MKGASDRLMEDMEKDKTSKVMFKVARQAEKDKKDVVGNACVLDKFGKLCVGESERARAWKQHMESVMNEENEWDGNVEADVVHGPMNRVTEEEVRIAITAMKLRKAAGNSGVVTEHVVASGRVGTEGLTEICNRLLAGECIPDDWKESMLVPLYKRKGAMRDCGAYRRVKLLEHGMKIVEKVFEKRLREMIEVDEMQCGFMPGKGTVDALFMVRVLQQKYGRKKRKLYMCFVDLEKAFDRVPRKVIEWALRKEGVNEILVGAVMRLYEGGKTRVKVTLISVSRLARCSSLILVPWTVTWNESGSARREVSTSTSIAVQPPMAVSSSSTGVKESSLPLPTLIAPPRSLRTV